MSHWIDRIVRGLTALSAIALAAMVLLTVADVLRSNIAHRPIVGAFDLVQALLVFIVFLGVPQIFFVEGNITVDVIDHLIGKRAVAFLRVIAGFASFAYLGLLWLHMFAPARDALRFGDVTSDLGMPVFWMWLPVLFGLPVALVAIIAVITRRLLGLRETGQKHE